MTVLRAPPSGPSFKMSLYPRGSNEFRWWSAGWLDKHQKEVRMELHKIEKVEAVKTIIQLLTKEFSTTKYVEFLDEIWKWAKDRADRDRGIKP